MKKYIIILIVFAFLIINGISNLYAAVSTLPEDFDYLEYETKHMQEHANARKMEEFYSISRTISLIVLPLVSILFAILSFMNKNIIKIYKITFLILLIVYIIANILAVNLNKSMFSIIRMEDYSMVGIVFLSVLFGFITKTNVKTIIISIIPSFVMLIFSIVSAFISFVNVEYLISDIVVGFEFSISATLVTQLILLPKYIKSKKNFIIEK